MSQFSLVYLGTVENVNLKTKFRGKNVRSWFPNRVNDSVYRVKDHHVNHHITKSSQKIMKNHHSKQYVDAWELQTFESFGI